MFSGESETTTVEEKERRAEEKEIKERVRGGGRRRKKVKVKKRRKKIVGGVDQIQASKTGHGTGFISRPPFTNSNPYFKDLNFPSLPRSFDKSADFSKFDAQFGGAVVPSEAASQGRLISRTQEIGSIPTSPTSPAAGSRSRLLLPKRRLFGSKATESGLQSLHRQNEQQNPSTLQLNPFLSFPPAQAPIRFPDFPSGSGNLTSFPPAQAPIEHQAELRFNAKENPRTLLSRSKVGLRPSRVLFGHKSQLVTSKRPQLQEPQFFTNVNIRFKPQQPNSSPTPAVRFRSSQSSGSRIQASQFPDPGSGSRIQASQDRTQFQLASFQSPESLPRFQKSQFLRGLDGSYTINTDL